MEEHRFVTLLFSSKASMKLTRLPLFVLLLTLLSSITTAQELRISDVEATVESMIPKSITDTTPGCVVGVVHQGKLIFSKGYGMANLAYNLPNDPKKLYNIGSVSKQFMGYAFAMIEAEGKINLDDPVHQYLEDWPKFKHAVTIRHLLSHTSGYREAYTMANLAGRMVGADRLYRQDCLDVVRKQPELEFEPGTKYTYNSTAWVILAEIFEKVTETPADQWVEANILQPLGMTNTRIESYIGEVIPNAAESYSFESDLGFINEKSNRAIFGAAEVYTSVEDMVHWMRNLSTSELGGKDVTARFLNTFKLKDGSDSKYGLGIIVDHHRGVTRFSHNGGHEAFITQLCYYPEHELGIFTVSNYGGNGIVRINQLAAHILEDFMNPAPNTEFKPAKVKEAQWKPILGMYVNADHNDFINVKEIDGKPTTWGGDELVAVSKTQYRLQGWGGSFEFKLQEDGTRELHLQADDTTVYYQQETVSYSVEDLAQFKGNFWSKELETVYHLKLDEAELSIHHRWLGKISLEPVSKDFFRGGFGIYVVFVRDEQGKVTGFNVNSGRTLNVFFEKRS